MMLYKKRFKKGKKSMNRIVKVLAFVLSFAMLVSLAPMSVLAGEQTNDEQTATVQEVTVSDDSSPSDDKGISGLIQEIEENAVSEETQVSEEAETTTEEEETQALREKTIGEELVTALSEDELQGGETISKGGTYKLKEGATGTITIDTTEAVTVVGAGVKWDENYTITSTKYSNLCFDAKQAKTSLVLKDLYIENTGDTAPIVNLQGAGNTVGIEGTVLLEQIGKGQGTYAAIHAAKGTDVTINGTGTLYMYKYSGGSGIGGNKGEMNGDITFGDEKSGLKVFIKGSKQGAVIGAGTGASQSSDVPGFVKFVEGEYNLISNSRGAVIGGAAGSAGASDGTTVYIEKKANININTDYSGAAIGGAGYDGGNDSSGGKLYVNGGSLRVYIDKNAASNTTGWMGKKYTEGVNDASITAARLNAKEEKVYRLVLDTSAVGNISAPYTVKVDDEVVYVGGNHHYGFIQEKLDKGDQLTVTSTPSNWYAIDENNLYLYVTGKDHKININGVDVQYYWDEISETFSTVKKYPVSLVVTDGTNVIEDASVVLSKGIGYTYTEETVEGKFVAAADDASAYNAFGLAEGRYTLTITKDGYYGSSFSFWVKEDGTVTEAGGNKTGNIFNYLSGSTFTIPLTKFTPSENSGAWDGKTIDVSWYKEGETKFYISTPAQLAGLAAIVNGIYNNEITTIIDGEKSYTPAEYAALEGKKIRPTTNVGSTGSQNLVTSSYYWYGVMSDGKTPADFNGKEIYITDDLDMGGYKTDGVWTGARYMTIGGQSLMHYISYGKWESDGLTHLGSSFNGKLYGQGHIIKNMYCDRYAEGSNFGDSQSVGLVGRLGNHDSDSADIAAVNPTVRDIAVSGYVYARRSVGGVVGKIGQTSATKSGDGSIGGIIENCLNFCEVHNTDSKGCGGIAGAGWNKGRIRNCANFGHIWSTYNCPTGGISGSNEVALINCYNVGKIEAKSASYAMGIGTNNGGASTITNCCWLTGTPQSGKGYYNGTGDIEITDNYDGTTLSASDYMKSAGFISKINGTGRTFVAAGADTPIYKLMQEEGAEGYPVPRVFTNDKLTVKDVQKVSDPTTLEYVEGQKFSTAGLVIKAIYSDGTTEEVENYTVSKTDVLETTDIKITVSVSVGGIEKSYEFNITVAQNELSELLIASAPKNKVYCKGEPLDTTGMVVKATYTNFPDNWTQLEPEDYTCEFSKDENDADCILVKYSYNGKELTKTTPVTIMEHDEIPMLNEEGYYELTCEDQLLWFANRVTAFGEVTINGKIMNDFSVGNTFTGIGSSSNCYGGTIDGNNCTITINKENTSGEFGFINYADTATVKNLTIDGKITNTSGSPVGAFIAQVYVNSTAATEGPHTTIVENCVNKADIETKGSAGGIVGALNRGSMTIRDCVNLGNITGTKENVGGIAGSMQIYNGISDHNEIIDCANYGIITGAEKLAGIAGSFSCLNAKDICRISGCRNYGAVMASGGKAAGIVGYAYGSSSEELMPVIENCGNEAAIEGASYIGGLIGYQNAKFFAVNSCYNAGTVNAKGAQYGYSTVGGIIGYCATSYITNVYNFGDVACGLYEGATPSTWQGVGGIIGTTNNTCTKIANAYNAGNVEGTGSGTASGPMTGAIVGYIAGDFTAENTYTLDGTSEYLCGGTAASKAFTIGEDVEKTTAELKALAGTLGESFMTNADDEYHGGYPILVWENKTCETHTFIEEKVIKEPTCTEAGEQELICKICGDKTTKELPALGHIDEDNDGICDRCKDYLKGFVKMEGSWYLYSGDSVKLIGFQKVGSGWYYLDPADNGKMSTGFKKVGSGWYYFRGGDSGRMLTGFQKINGAWYYFKGGDSGRMLTGFQKINGSWYYFKGGDSGRMLTGFQKINGAWYYFKPGDSGKMLTGFQKINGRWYYFKTGDSGRMLTGWQKINGAWYYFKTGDSGMMLTGWQKINNKWYYFKTGDSGRMLTGTQVIDGKTYVFASNGVLIK